MPTIWINLTGSRNRTLMRSKQDVSQQHPPENSVLSRNVTPHVLIVAALVVIIFAGAAAIRQIYPESWWVQRLLSGERFAAWLIGWGTVLYTVERWLVRHRWYSKSWFMKELGRRRADGGESARRSR